MILLDSPNAFVLTMLSGQVPLSWNDRGEDGVPSTQVRFGAAHSLWRTNCQLVWNAFCVGAPQALQSIGNQDSVLEVWNFNSNFSDSAQAMHLRWFESPSVSMLWRVDDVDGLRFGDLSLDVSTGSGEIILFKSIPSRTWGHLLGWLQSLLPGLSLVLRQRSLFAPGNGWIASLRISARMSRFGWKSLGLNSPPGNYQRSYIDNVAGIFHHKLQSMKSYWRCVAILFYS